MWSMNGLLPGYSELQLTLIDLHQGKADYCARCIRLGSHILSHPITTVRSVNWKLEMLFLRTSHVRGRMARDRCSLF